jgi:hypothetical protein
MAELKPKTFYYKRAKPGPGANLQSLLKAAFSKHVTIGDRAEKLRENDQTRFVTLHKIREGVLFGVVICYTEGNNQATVGVDLTQTELSLQQIEPPTDAAGKKNEFIEGTLYFGVRENHIVLLQSRGFRSGQFEDHINWLLRHKLPENQHPELVKIVDVAPANAGPHQRSGVKTLTIQTQVEFQPTVEALVMQTKGKAIELVKKAVELYGRSSTEAFGFEEALKTGDIGVTLQVKYNRRGTDPKAMLDNLAAQFTHTDDDYFKMDLEIPGFGIVGIDTLRIKERFRIETINGLPEPNSVFRKMREWLETLASNNTIS